MKKSSKLIVSMLAALAVTPAVATIAQVSLPTIQVQAQQAQQLVSLGGSLNAQQAEMTKNLLGATNVANDNILYVNGDIINKYLHDGSNAGTTVYSSAYIEKQAAGYGVQVQIVTPQNITAVSATTYQNAAITSGAKDVQIRIATVSPVTGEGALAGVYALLEKSGVKVDQKSVQVAEKEIKVVEVVKDSGKTTDTGANQVISQIKKEVTQKQVVEGQNIDAQQAETIVNQTIEQINSNNQTNNTTNNTTNNVTNNNTTNVTNNVTLNLSDEAKQELVKFAQEYAQTEAAKSKETIQQLEKSVDNSLNAPWSEVLSNIQDEQSVEDILKAERKDYSDAAVYNPVIPAMFKRFYEQAEKGEPVLDIYGHTFILEKLVPNMKPEEKQAINQLRVYLYYYTQAKDKEKQAALGSEYVTVKDRWLRKVNGLAPENPTLNALIEKVAMASGYATEAYTYDQGFMSQNGTKISVMVKVDEVTHVSTVDTFEYDTQTGQVSLAEPMTPIANSLFDFAKVYGVGVQGTYTPSVQIPADYKIPGYQEQAQPAAETSTSAESAAQPAEQPATQQPATPDQPASEQPQEAAPVSGASDKNSQ